MKDELAGALLNELMEWSDEERARWTMHLRWMSAYKYDHYEGFAPGERFFESLARWLVQFTDHSERRRLLTFVLEQLIFISREELNHAIACVYPDVIKPDLIADVSESLQVPAWCVRRIVDSPEFRTMRRKTLYLGLSDGARLDQLRRSSPELSHEQFWLTPDIAPSTRQTMIEKLDLAMTKQHLLGERRFVRVVFVDDFYGSGATLLREGKDGQWAGKLARARDELRDLMNDGVAVTDPKVSVVLYICSALAETNLRDLLAIFEPSWTLRVVQPLPDEIVVRDPDLVRLSEWFFDPVLVDEHKGQVPLGFGNAALPLVLHHNAPNNSISLIWADSADESDGLERHALFPRYERHHVDRP